VSKMATMTFSFNYKVNRACYIAFGQQKGQTRMLPFLSVNTVLCFMVEVLLTLYQELSTFVSEVWDKHNGERCVGVAWDLFSDKSELMVSDNMYECSTGNFILAIFL